MGYMAAVANLLRAAIDIKKKMKDLLTIPCMSLPTSWKKRKLTVWGWELLCTGPALPLRAKNRKRRGENEKQTTI